MISSFWEKGNGLREELLSLNGIGPETADSILLYAALHPEFVVDAYTRRIFSRHGLVSEAAKYDEVKALFTDNLPPDAAMFNEYHALIVKVGKDYCRTKTPRCSNVRSGIIFRGRRKTLMVVKVLCNKRCTLEDAWRPPSV